MITFESFTSTLVGRADSFPLEFTLKSLPFFSMVTDTSISASEFGLLTSSCDSYTSYTLLGSPSFSSFLFFTGWG